MPACPAAGARRSGRRPGPRSRGNSGRRRPGRWRAPRGSRAARSAAARLAARPSRPPRPPGPGAGLVLAVGFRELVARGGDRLLQVGRNAVLELLLQVGLLLVEPLQDLAVLLADVLQLLAQPFQVRGAGDLVLDRVVHGGVAEI